MLNSVILGRFGKAFEESKFAMLAPCHVTLPRMPKMKIGLPM
jgi:hypothetical protein